MFLLNWMSLYTLRPRAVGHLKHALCSCFFWHPTAGYVQVGDKGIVFALIFNWVKAEKSSLTFFPFWNIDNVPAEKLEHVIN